MSEPCPKLLMQQRVLEREMFLLGQERDDLLRNRFIQKQSESLSRYGTAMVVGGVDLLVQQIELHQRAIECGRAGLTFSLLKHLVGVDPEVIAAVAMRVVTDSISSEVNANTIGYRIADALWVEIMLIRASDWERMVHARVRRRGNLVRNDVMRMRNTVAWSRQERLGIGAFLLRLVAAHTGLVEIVNLRKATTVVPQVKATDLALDWIRNAVDRTRYMAPMTMPMVVPPLPWTSGTEGGYLTTLPNNQLVKDQDCSGMRHVGQPVFEAINIQQGIEFRLDPWMHRQLEVAWENDQEIGRMIPRTGWQIPPYPADKEPGSADVQQWKFAARIIHERNDRAKQRRIVIAKQLWLANKFKGRSIYFPMQLDFRGRLYYRPPFINPQANDIARGLLRFRPTPLTDEGWRWLRIHGATAYGHGFSRLSWQDREDWTLENREAIFRCGNDPFGGGNLWRDADDPWQFLAFCRAYTTAVIQAEQGNQPACGLPVKLDATCSGIQHYAALLRDPGMAGMVNLTSDGTGQPSDIYTRLMQEVLTRLRVDAQAGSERMADARHWLALQPDRSLAKQVVMTIPYSASRRAIFNFVQTWAIDRALELYGREAWPFKSGAVATTHYMSTLMADASLKMVAPAVRAMKWFKAVGRLAGKIGMPLEWETPSGLVVCQQYELFARRQITLRRLTPVPIGLSVFDKPMGLCPKKMANGLSANVIHSLDASHMALATIRARLTGVANIAGIHDCWATTPSEMPALREAVRHTFAEMYQQDWLGRITSSLVDQIPAEYRADLPVPPAKGSWDPTTANTSEYFIA
jgi:DNA-directed RNA polymerase